MSRVLLLPLALGLAGISGAQERPDLSGEWTYSEDRASTVAATGDASFRKGDMGSGWGPTIRITHRADSLIVTYVFFANYDLQPPLRFAYAMDGTETRNAIMIGHATAEQLSKVGWQGATLVITTLHRAPNTDGRGASAEVRQALTLDSPTSLTIETTRVGALGGATTTTKTVYSKR